MITLKKYTLDELKQELGISKWQWDQRKNDLLEHLKIYFDYDIIKQGKGYCIDIYEQYAEYEPLPKKTRTPEIKEYYYEQTKEEIKKQPWNTGSNIARNIEAKNKNKYDHVQGTMGNYIRPIIKEKFLPPHAKAQWMRLSDDRLSYVPLTQEELDYFTSLFNSKSQEEKEIIGKQRAGYITKREAKEQILELAEIRYDQAIFMFRDKFGYMPQYVKHLEEVIQWEEEQQ